MIDLNTAPYLTANPSSGPLIDLAIYRMLLVSRLRDAVGRIGWPVDVIVVDEDLAERRAKVRGTMVHHALREGRIVARSVS